MRKTISSRIIILITVVLIVSNSIICVASVFILGSAMKQSIRQRMLDIANCASGSIDGDVLGSLTEEDVGSPAYPLIANMVHKT